MSDFETPLGIVYPAVPIVAVETPDHAPAVWPLNYLLEQDDYRTLSVTQGNRDKDRKMDAEDRLLPGPSLVQQLNAVLVRHTNTSLQQHFDTFQEQYGSPPLLGADLFGLDDAQQMGFAAPTTVPPPAETPPMVVMPASHPAPAPSPAPAEAAAPETPPAAGDAAGPEAMDEFLVEEATAEDDRGPPLEHRSHRRNIMAEVGRLIAHEAQNPGTFARFNESIDEESDEPLYEYDPNFVIILLAQYVMQHDRAQAELLHRRSNRDAAARHARSMAQQLKTFETLQAQLQQQVKNHMVKFQAAVLESHEHMDDVTRCVQEL